MVLILLVQTVQLNTRSTKYLVRTTSNLFNSIILRHIVSIRLFSKCKYTGYVHTLETSAEFLPRVSSIDRKETCVEAQEVLSLQPYDPTLNVLTFPPPLTGGCSEGLLEAFRFFLSTTKHTMTAARVLPTQSSTRTKNNKALLVLLYKKKDNSMKHSTKAWRNESTFLCAQDYMEFQQNLVSGGGGGSGKGIIFTEFPINFSTRYETTNKIHEISTTRRKYIRERHVRRQNTYGRKA